MVIDKILAATVALEMWRVAQAAIAATHRQCALLGETDAEIHAAVRSVDAAQEALETALRKAARNV